MNIVCFSGGHSSALVAIETVRKYGKEETILLNHNVSSHVEHESIKKFKDDISNYLDVPITYANADNYEDRPPLTIAQEFKGFQFDVGNALCTYNLKTKPFYSFIENLSKTAKLNIIYGFDENEEDRILRRRTILKAMGHKSEYPLADWNGTLEKTEDIGINRPVTYKIWKHANCIGCLKAGRQHWYCVYCLRPDIYQEALDAEENLKHSIIKGVFLSELTPKFKEMRESKLICPNDKENSNSFWARVESTLPEQETLFPCDCSY